MKKIPTLFERRFEDHKVVDVLPVFTNAECARAVMFGSATVKYDGSCCAIIDGKFYKRYDAKKGKPIPGNAIKCQEEADPVTGHLPCWVPVDINNPADKWFITAFNNVCAKDNMLPDHTYEAIGPHFQCNPYNLEHDILRCHGMTFCDDFNIRPLKGNLLPSMTCTGDYLRYIRGYLTSHEIEGIVFWYDGAPVCKIKRTDFGLPWPVK